MGVCNEGLPPKRKKRLPQNKPSRDEPCLSRCNTSSMVVSADPRNMAALTQFISSAMRVFWPWLCCTCFFVVVFSPITVTTKQPWAADPAIDEILDRGRLDSSRFGLFWGNFFSFWRKSLSVNGRDFFLLELPVFFNRLVFGAPIEAVMTALCRYWKSLV